jgi:hypothetical protein
MWQLQRAGILGSLVLVLTACGGQTAAPPDALNQAVASIEPSAHTVIQPTPTASMSSTFGETSQERSVSWHGLTINIPPQHIWHEGAYGEGHSYSAPIVAQGRINYDVATDLPPRPDPIIMGH